MQINFSTKTQRHQSTPKDIRNGLHIEYDTKAQKHQNPTKRSS